MSRTGIALRSCLIGLAALLAAACGEGRLAPIRIGVLHSLTGTMAASERPLVDAARLAVGEINAAGGLLGRPVEIVVADGRSDDTVFAAEAERLIAAEKVDALFACWTSGCRQAVRPVVEKHKHLMFYPVQYEGMESSPHILYTGAAPNQQIVPGTRWALREFGARVYLVGSDYVFPRTANRIVRDLVAANNGRVLAERYLPLGTHDKQALAALAEDIRRQRPDVVLNTINGDSNATFFDALAIAGLADLPVVSFSVAEPEMRAWGGQRLTRHYGVWNYFQSIPLERNRRFVAAFKARAGADALTSDPVEATYAGVHLWANAVRAVGAATPAQVNSAALLRQSFSGPSGIIAVDARTRHLWKHVRIGKAEADGQFVEVFASSIPIRPTPWPLYRTPEEWRALIAEDAS
jgi:urea transport system substrate-binding protein